MKNFAIIGCGNIAHTHARVIQALDNANLVACCDIDKNKLSDFSEIYSCKGYQDYHQLLADEKIDIISICSPNYLHKAMSIDSFKANKHVLCEKPMAMNIVEANEVLADRNGLSYAVCYQNRLNPSSIVLKRSLEEKLYGEFKGAKCFMTWHRPPEYYTTSDWKGRWSKEGGGALINQAIHTLDLITWLVGMPEKIKGKIMTALLDDVIEVEDNAMACAVMDNGAPVNIFVTNNFVSDPSPEILLSFEKAEIKLTMNTLVINNEEVVIKEEQDLAFADKSYWGDSHKELIRAFIDEIEGNDNELKSYLSSDSAINSLNIVESIYKSSDKNQWKLLK